MTNVFLERKWEDPLTSDVLHDMVNDSLGCFGLHRVDWQESFLSNVNHPPRSRAEGTRCRVGTYCPAWSRYRYANPLARHRA